MPTYEYKCPKCEKFSEEFHKMYEQCIKYCPECYEKMIKCVGGGIGLHFKGSGFYETDYKGK